MTLRDSGESGWGGADRRTRVYWSTLKPNDDGLRRRVTDTERGGWRRKTDEVKGFVILRRKRGSVGDHCYLTQNYSILSFSCIRYGISYGFGQSI